MNDYLDRLEAQLTRLTEQGAHQRMRARRPDPPRRRTGGPRPPRRSSEIFAFLAAAAVVVAVVAIVLGNVHTGKPRPTAANAKHSTTTAATGSTTGTKTTTTTAPPPPPTPTHFAPQSFTAIGELTWWLLGAGPCPAGEQPPCGSILQTTDGGRSFHGMHAPRATLSGDGSAPGYSQLRFADAHNGFAYGPDLYATHDGSQTWQRVNVGGTVTALAISAGTVYATVEPAGGSGRLMRSPVGHGDWTTVSAAGVASAGLWVQGSDVIVQSGAGTGASSSILVSQDGGASFTAHPSPSAGFPCQLQAPEPPVLWAECPTGTLSSVSRSADLGAHFTTVVSTGLPLPNSAAFAAASASTAVVGYQKLYRTTDDGGAWNPVGPSGVSLWAFLGFTDATHGVALGYVGSTKPANERLYYTTDAGQTYHRVSLP